MFYSVFVCVKTSVQCSVAEYLEETCTRQELHLLFQDWHIVAFWPWIRDLGKIVCTPHPFKNEEVPYGYITRVYSLLSSLLAKSVLTAQCSIPNKLHFSSSTHINMTLLWQHLCTCMLLCTRCRLCISSQPCFCQCRTFVFPVSIELPTCILMFYIKSSTVT